LAVSRSDTYGARSRHLAGLIGVADPGRDQSRHARDLAEAAAQIGAAVVLPGTEASLRALTGREDLFEPGQVIGTSSRRALDQATDKATLSELVRAAGLEPVPTKRLEDADPLGVPLPAVLKPLRSVVDSGPGLRRCETVRVDSRAELQAVSNRDDGQKWLLQPYVEGTLAAVCGVAWRGQLVCAVHQRSPRIWPPGVGNSCYAMTTPPDRVREAGVAALLRSLGWSGIFGVQFLVSRGHAYVIDFNPRIYGSMTLAIRAGLNLPAIWADLLLGRPVPAMSYRPGIRYRVEEDDFRAAVRAWRDGRRREVLAAFLPRRRTVHAVFSWRDPKPSVVSLRKLTRTLAHEKRPQR
jgi:predicted ATP-grasp superfamily ATP-dependent carboligase